MALRFAVMAVAAAGCLLPIGVRSCGTGTTSRSFSTRGVRCEHEENAPPVPSPGRSGFVAYRELVALRRCQVSHRVA